MWFWWFNLTDSKNFRKPTGGVVKDSSGKIVKDSNGNAVRQGTSAPTGGGASYR